MYAVLLDACVLVPNALCDTLLRFAEAGFYRPLWSERILDEVSDAIIRVHPDLSPERARRRLDIMNGAFEDAPVNGWTALAAGLDLPDPDDRHVLAAAIAGGAQTLVTFNLKDFPDLTLSEHSVVARHPDEFLLDQLDLFPSAALRILIEQAADLQAPKADLAAVLNRLERIGVPNFANAVRRLAPEDV